MPIRKKDNKYHWGSKGPFSSRKKAEQVARAAYASGYEGSVNMEKISDREVVALARVAHPVLPQPLTSFPVAALAGMAANKLMGDDGSNESEGLNEQDAHAQAEWKNIHKEIPPFGYGKFLLKLMKFVHISKIGYTTQPEDRSDPDSGRSQELTPAWQGGSESVKKIGRDIGNQSFGLPALGSKEHHKIQDTIFDVEGKDMDDLTKRAFADPVAEAHNYLNSIKNQRHNSSMGTHNYNEIQGHMSGHRDLATVQNIMQFGEDYLDHPDAIRYLKHGLRNPKHSWEAADAAERKGREYTEPYYTYEPPMGKTYEDDSYPNKFNTEMTIPLEAYHKQLVHGHLDPNMSNAGKGMADELHKRIRMESPHYDPEAEEAYQLSQWPASFHTTGRSDLGPSKYTEIVGGVSSQGGGIAHPWRDEPGGTEGPMFKYPTHEQRREHYQEAQEYKPGQVESMRNRKGFSFEPRRKRGHLSDTPNVFERRFPDLYDDKEKSIGKSLLKLIKEGDGEGAFNGLSGTVFVSSHAGIFTPTFSGSKVRRIHNKNKRKQERKRHKLMGKDKKNGVDRLVQFLHDGSPTMHKAEPDKDMTGQMQSHSAAGNRVHNLKQIDWKKRQEGISKVEDHPTMGMSNGRDKKIHEAGTAATYPTQDDPSSMHQRTARAPDWNSNNYRVHKQDEIPPNIQNASTEVTGIGPPTNANTMAAIGNHPQAAFTEESSDEEKKQQVITQNDFENRVKQYDNKEEEKGNIDQPRAAGAIAAMSNYPDSNMQMMEKEWGSGPDSYGQDDLHRGGDKDISEDEEDIDEKKRKADDDTDWIPEDEAEVKSEKVWLDNFQALYKSFTMRGHENPLLAALLAGNFDNAHAL